MVKSYFERVLGKLVYRLKLQMVKWALSLDNSLCFGNILNYFSYYHIKVLICFTCESVLVEVRKLGTSREFSPTLHTLCHMPSGVQDNIRFYVNRLISSDPLLGWRYQHHSRHYAPHPAVPDLYCK